MRHVTHNIESRDTFVPTFMCLLLCANRSVPTVMHTSLHNERIMSHLWTSQVKRMNESRANYLWVTSQIMCIHVWMCHMYGCVMACVCMSHVTRMCESYHICECVSHIIYVNEYVWVMSYSWMSMCESCHICEWVSWHAYSWVTSQVMRHVTGPVLTCMNTSWHTYEWVMSHIWVSHVTHMGEIWLTQTHLWRGYT